MTPGFRLPLISLATALLLTLAACGGDKDKADEGPPPGVLVATAGMVQIADTIEYIGRTVAVNDAQLRAQVEGYLMERRFEEGDDIEADAELFVIDPALYEAQVAAAKGSVAEVEAALNRAEQDVARQAKLVKQKAASKQRLEEAEAAKLTAEARLISAKAALQKAEIDLGHTVIRAPFKGRIGRAFYSIGSLVTPSSDALARLVELDPIYVNFSVSEGDVIETKRRLMDQGRGEIREAVVKLRLPDGKMFKKEGQIDFIDNVVDRKTGTVILRAKFPNPDKLLVPGLYVRTVLGRKQASNKLTIPQSAIQEDQAGKFVMVVDPDNKVEQRRIKTGRADAGNIVVRDGLQAGEKVIVEGIQKVRPGVVVDAKEAKNPNPKVQMKTDNPVTAPDSAKDKAKADADKGQADDQASEPVDDQASDQAIDQPGDQAKEQADDPVVEKAAGEASGQVAEQLEEEADQVIEEAAEKARQADDQANEQAGDQADEQDQPAADDTPATSSGKEG